MPSTRKFFQKFFDFLLKFEIFDLFGEKCLEENFRFIVLAGIEEFEELFLHIVGERLFQSDRVPFAADDEGSLRFFL